MKRILTISTLILIFAIGFSACGKIEKGTPSAIKKLIREKKHICSTKVVEYTYYEDLVYFFNSLGCNDGASYAYDKKGNELWHVDGMTGRMEGPKDFFEKAVFKRIIWTSRSTKE